MTRKQANIYETMCQTIIGIVIGLFLSWFSLTYIIELGTTWGTVVTTMTFICFSTLRSFLIRSFFSRLVTID